jgi:hypothetical protein
MPAGSVLRGDFVFAIMRVMRCGRRILLDHVNATKPSVAAYTSMVERDGAAACEVQDVLIARFDLYGYPDDGTRRLAPYLLDVQARMSESCRRASQFLCDLPQISGSQESHPCRTPYRSDRATFQAADAAVFRDVLIAHTTSVQQII